MRVLDLSHGDIHDISYEELQNQFEKDIYRIRVLEQALDRACETLGNGRGCPIDNLKMNNDGEIDCKFENHDCKKCWREHLMIGEN